MTHERRSSARSRAHVYFNKYIDGHPHLCEIVDLSATGMLIRKVHEPRAPRAVYAVELADEAEGAGGDRLWLCASPVWSDQTFEALSFVGQSDRDRERLEGVIARLESEAA